MTLRYIFYCHCFKIFFAKVNCLFEESICSISSSSDERAKEGPKKAKEKTNPKKKATSTKEKVNPKKKACVTVKRPAKKSSGSQQSSGAKPYLVMFYKSSGKCAIRQGTGAKKQLFQFGGKDFNEEDLRDIAKTAISNIINNTLDENTVRQFVDDEVSKLARDVN